VTTNEVPIHGHRIRYRIAGEGDPIVLVHGMAGSSETWEPVIPRLAETARVIAPDLLGHGSSAKPQGDYSLGALASHLRDLLVAVGIERATIVGHSLGGGIAMQFAYQFPERCERLVLVSSGGLGVDVNALLRLLSVPGSEYMLSLLCADPFARGGGAVASWLDRLPQTRRLASVVRMYVSLNDADTRAAFLLTLRAVIDPRGQRVSAADRLYLAAHMPTLIVWGGRDPIIPVSHAHAAHLAMPGSVLEVFERAGHFPHQHDPERFADVVSNFIASTDPVPIDLATVIATATAAGREPD
jgi:pimeloyl-ACP methyl ester carboxylesterase